MPERAVSTNWYDDDAIDRTRLIDAINNVFAHAAYVILIVIVANVGDVANPLATGKSVVKTAGLVEVCGIQFQSSGCASRHVAQKVSFGCVVHISDTGANTITFVQ